MRRAVYAASFSPDGRRIVTASDDETARVWDAESGKPVGEPMRHEDGVIAASFSPDGRRIVTASGDEHRAGVGRGERQASGRANAP